ncbi:adenosylcobinamide-GDP ribazoletransferase [Thiothrix subterranea]|uniref:Adenosylcobinamide-GDP ribazoletransferase n=1 Tax=Thiothrix subterranea TaxID=2735563 RepID=A0AA51MS22_9GAMM|nr:adenosylcobinamide-GDP ribazoletransferase [Thiothrix subterranea]MDQ5767278.1 adenosylcobinamide-GDP ribazoletransferase [Thiothrix subterranea]WML88859.1 adenosylcobinamide-GDP ribazoletransferase [Thiothrix subterranea]
MKAVLRSFQVALRVLTLLPAPSIATFSAEEKGRGLIWFPVIGALMGGLLALTAWRLQGIEPMLASVILLTAWLFISELHHLDALARSVNVWLFGGQSAAVADDTEAAQLPMPHFGVMGVMALVMMVKFSALSVLIEYKLWLYIMMAPLAARLLVAALIGFTPSAPGQTLAQDFRVEFPYVALFIWLLLALPIALVAGIPLLGVFVLLLLIRLRLKQTSGGLTWESIGASIVLLEAVGLFVAAVTA